MIHALLPRRTSAPAATPVSLAEAKAHLRVEHSEDDTLITAMITAATERLDGWSGILGRCLVMQTWVCEFDGFPCSDRLRLPLAPLGNITSVTFRDSDNVERTLSADTYYPVSDNLGPAVNLVSALSWPSTYDRADAVTVTASFGYGAASAVPAPIKAAILLMVGDLYRNRESGVVGPVAVEVKMSATVDALLAPYRRRVL